MPQLLLHHSKFVTLTIENPRADVTTPGVSKSELEKTGQRGPVDHERRDQIIQAADEHFRHFGYTKTTVTDLAKAVGVSSAYIYRFFESKQAIGEAICSMTLGKIHAILRQIASDSKLSHSQRLQGIFEAIVREGLMVFFQERRLHEIVSVSVSEQWQSTRQHVTVIREILTGLIAGGRDTGEFENATDLEGTSRAIVETLMPFAHPTLLEQKGPDELYQNSRLVADLVLRSLTKRA